MRWATCPVCGAGMIEGRIDCGKDDQDHKDYRDSLK